MRKKVNVKSHIPVVGIKHPIVGNVRGITLEVEDILTCIRSKAKVEEVIGARIIPLDFTNYDKDNSIKEETVEVEVPKVLNVTQINGTLTVEAPVAVTTPVVEVVDTPAVEVEATPVVEEVPVAIPEVKEEVTAIDETPVEDKVVQGKNKYNR